MDYNFEKMKENIFSIISGVRSVYLRIRDLTISKLQLESKIADLDSKHSSFNEERGNTVFLIQRLLSVLLIVMVLTLDYILLMNAILVFGEHFNWPEMLTYGMPSFLVLSEFLACFSLSKKAAEGHDMGWFGKLCQYLIIAFLLGVTIFSIIYDVEGYVPEIDKISYRAYLTSSVIVQVCIFVFSAILHIIQIQKVTKIADAIMYFVYSGKRAILVNKLVQVDKQINVRVNPNFNRKANVLILAVYEFDKKYPGEKNMFLVVMEQGLIDEINTRMGKIVL